MMRMDKLIKNVFSLDTFLIILLSFTVYFAINAFVYHWIENNTFVKENFILHNWI